MEQLHILRCQVWKSILCPKGPISVQRFKEAVRFGHKIDFQTWQRRMCNCSIERIFQLWFDKFRRVHLAYLVSSLCKIRQAYAVDMSVTTVHNCGRNFGK